MARERSAQIARAVAHGCRNVFRRYGPTKISITELERRLYGPPHSEVGGDSWGSGIAKINSITVANPTEDSKGEIPQQALDRLEPAQFSVGKFIRHSADSIL